MPTARSGHAGGGRPPGRRETPRESPVADGTTYGRVARPVKAMASFLPVIE